VHPFWPVRRAPERLHQERSDPRRSATVRQNLVRKHLIRYGGGQRHRSDERAESQDRSRPGRALVLAWQQPDNQLKVIPDLFGGKRTSPFIAASDLRRQCAEGTARTRIVAVRVAQVVADKLRDG
jgi:hypothetical protein